MPKIKCEGWVPPNKAQESVDMLREIFNNRGSLDITFDTEERFSYHIDDIKTNTFYHKSIIEKLNSPKTVQDFCKANRCWAAMDVGGAWYQYDKNNKPYLTAGQWYSTFNIQIHKIENVIFPKVLWDKSLVAPDGRLILIEGKKQKKKKVYKFKAGKWYKHKKYGTIIKCTRSIAGNLVFESEGCVLGMLGVEASCDWYEMKNYKPKKPVITVDYEDMAIKPLTLEEIKKFSSTWDKLNTIGKAVNPNLYIKPLLKRGEPVFVWDRCHNPRLPAVVRYFHSFDKDGIGVFTCNESLYNEQGTWYQYYRRYDSTLVGVPRKDWPKISV